MFPITIRKPSTEMDRSLQDLHCAHQIAVGTSCKHWFRGDCDPDDVYDIDWFIGVMSTYKRQYETGLCCLLDNDINSVYSVLKKLEERKQLLARGTNND